MYRPWCLYLRVINMEQVKQFSLALHNWSSYLDIQNNRALSELNSS